MDSNASRAREVERKVWRENDSLLRGSFLRRCSSSSASPLFQVSEIEGQRCRAGVVTATARIRIASEG